MRIITVNTHSIFCRVGDWSHNQCGLLYTVTHFKISLYRFGGKNIGKELDWEQINIAFRDVAPHFLLLVDLLLSIPAHSSECERGFSLMKIVKTDWRNCLTDDALTDLVRINLHCADIKEFIPDQAIHLWNKASVRGRRLNHDVWKKKKEKAAASDSDKSSESEDEEQDTTTEANATSSTMHVDGVSLFDSGSESDSEFHGFEI